tara:strand:+ start:550 stop:1062 length:513 start_codon:yes stop_codon:yes gene_type:complete
MATTARKALDLDEVIFVPCYVSPFKSGTVASGRQRFEMLALSVDEAGLDWANVSEFEIEKKGPSYSWETACYFLERDPEADWYWILGTDQWDSILDWANPECLREHLKFIVLTRDGQLVKEREGWQSTAVPFSHAASSTAIRGDLNKHHGWVTGETIQYCREHGLYGEDP